MLMNLFKKTISSGFKGFNNKNLLKTTRFVFSCHSGENQQYCQKGSCTKGVRAIVRNEAPRFSGTAYWNGEFKKISLDDFKGKYVVLFFYPLDFTFVCPTEIVAYNDLAPEYEKVNCQLIACSIDSHFTHREWANKPRSSGGLSPMSIPMLADISQDISRVYGVRVNGENDDVKGASMRGTFIIDGKGVLKSVQINDLPVGRNAEETLRLVKAFQHVEKHGEVCQSNWTPGKSGMTPGNSSKLNEFWKKEHGSKH